MATIESPRIHPLSPATMTAVRTLVAGDVLGSLEDVLDFLEKPHKWQPELDLWANAGSPQPDTPAWALFEARLRRHLEDGT